MGVFGTPYFTVSLSETLSVGSEDKQAGPDKKRAQVCLTLVLPVKEPRTLAMPEALPTKPTPGQLPAQHVGSMGPRVPGRCARLVTAGPMCPCFKGCESACPHSQKPL